LIAEQLQAARAAHWRQQQSPLLTLDDAQSWFAQHPLCLYLPRHAQLPAPAPSFVEACAGSRLATPGAEALAQAQALLVRLVASGTVVPLNLLGTVSEQPDFLAHTDALPFVLSLRADADWKHAPQKSSGHKVSPLVLELWKALEKDGSLTAGEAREALGRELTEAAVLRGMCELWQTLRISPVFPGVGEPARWEMLRVHHRAALTTAGNTGQVTAISLLVSMYLQSVYAASSDEIEIFLSPVASRSRVREAVRGLAATRQIQSLSMDAQTYYFLEGGLPEFADVAAAEISVTPDALPAEPRRPLPAPRKVQATRPPGAPVVPAAEPIFRRPRPVVPPAEMPAASAQGQRAERPAGRPAASAYVRKSRAPGEGSGERPPFRPKRTFSPAAGRPAGFEAGAEARSGPPRRPYDKASPARGGSARPGAARPGSPRPRPSRPDSARPDSDRPASARPGFARPASARSDSARPPFSRPASPGPDSSRPASARPPSARPGSARPGFSRPGSARPGAARPSSSRPASPRPGFERPGSARSDGPPRRDARPARTGERPTHRPGNYSGAAKRESPKPWALPGRKSGAPARPPRPGGRGEAPFRPAQNRPSRPPAGGAPEGAAPFRPRAPRGERGPGDASRGRSAGAPGRPAGRPSAYRTTERPRGDRPERTAGARSGPPTSRPYTPRTRPASGGGSAPPRGAGSDRPRPGGRPPFKPRPGGSPGREGGSKPRPPFVPGGAPRKPSFGRTGPRPGGPARKPGKPRAGERERKPERKKPDA
jgi:23S rRNA pseudouridine2605 synthase